MCMEPASRCSWADISSAHTDVVNDTLVPVEEWCRKLPQFDVNFKFVFCSPLVMERLGTKKQIHTKWSTVSRYRSYS